MEYRGNREYEINSFKRVVMHNNETQDTQNIIPFNGTFLNVQTDKRYYNLSNALKDALNSGYSISYIVGYNRD